MRRSCMVMALVGCGSPDPAPVVESKPVIAPVAVTPPPVVAPPPVVDRAMRVIGCAPAAEAPRDGIEPRASGPEDTRAHVSLGNTHRQGDLDRGTIRRHIQRASPRLRSCYEREPARRDAVATVMINLLINANGTVGYAVAQAVSNDEFGRCAAEAIKSIVFPTPGGGGIVQVSQTIAFFPPKAGWPAAPAAAAPAVIAPPTTTYVPPRAWTPFATKQGATVEVASAAHTAVTASLPALDTCFGAANGSLRAMLDLKAGAVATVRVGGLGNADVEACVAKQLRGLTIAGTGEVACDLAKGDPQPWRLALGEDYTVIEVTRTEVRPDRDVPRDATAVIVLDADVPAARIAAALPRVRASAATLVAVRGTDRAITFVGVAADGRPAKRDPRELIELGTASDGQLLACIDPQRVPFALGEPASLDAAIAKVLRTCTKRPELCRTDAMRLAGAGATTAGQLGELATAGQRAKLVGLVGSADCVIDP